jgi:hypothetical protein
LQPRRIQIPQIPLGQIQAVEFACHVADARPPRTARLLTRGHRTLVLNRTPESHRECESLAGVGVYQHAESLTARRESAVRRVQPVATTRVTSWALSHADGARKGPAASCHRPQSPRRQLFRRWADRL